MELRFHAMLYSNLGNKYSDLRAIPNVHAGRRFTTPGLKQGFPTWGTCTPTTTIAYLKVYI